MAVRVVRQQLHDEIAIWFADGLIRKETLETLRRRYEAERFGWIGAIKYLGITGGLLAFFGIVGLITVLAESTAFAALVLAGLGAAITWWALHLARDVPDRYATSSKVLMTLGAVLWTGGVGLVFQSVGFDGPRSLILLGLVNLPIGFVLSYRARNIYLLLLTLLALFHWVGSWNTMAGRSTYEIGVQDPRVMSLVSVAVIAVGVFHERRLYPRTGSFYRVWESIGLLYLNVSLLILSIWERPGATRVAWVILFTLACAAQIVAGSLLHNRLIRAFGITFLAIDLFTRFHEQFWARLDLGAYLAVGGALLAALGACAEVLGRRYFRRGGAA